MHKKSISQMNTKTFQSHVLNKIMNLVNLERKNKISTMKKWQKWSGFWKSQRQYLCVLISTAFSRLTEELNSFRVSWSKVIIPLI